MEYQMAMNNFDNMVLEQGVLEITTRDSTRKKSNYEHLGLCMKWEKKNGQVVLKMAKA